MCSIKAGLIVSSSSSNGKSKAPSNVDYELDELVDSDDDDSATVIDDNVLSIQHAIVREAKIKTSFGSSSMAGPSIDRSKP